MKEILLTLIYFLLIKISSQKKLHILNKYKSFIYDENYTTYACLESINVEGKEIELTYEIHNGSFSNSSLYYYFTDTKPEENTNFEKIQFQGPVFSKKNETSISKNKNKTTYRIKKDKKLKYIILQNLENKEGKTIEVKNKRTSKKTVIVIFVISLIIICAIIATFVFVGKYIYSKRQKEVMTNYATSFVAENPGLVPNEESNAIIENNEINEKRDSQIKIDD